MVEAKESRGRGGERGSDEAREGEFLDQSHNTTLRQFQLLSRAFLISQGYEKQPYESRWGGACTLTPCCCCCYHSVVCAAVLLLALHASTPPTLMLDPFVLTETASITGCLPSALAVDPYSVLVPQEKVSDTLPSPCVLQLPSRSTRLHTVLLYIPVQPPVPSGIPTSV